MHRECSGFLDYKILCKFKMISALYSWNVFSLETFNNCKVVKHIMIMIYNSHYAYFFILCNIWSTVENYFQKILRPLTSWKKQLPPFY